MANLIPQTQRERILAMIQDRHPGYHPLLSIAEIANDMDEDVRVRLSCHQTIVKYVESELKSVEVTAEIVEERRVIVSLFEGEYEVVPEQKSIEAASSHEPVRNNAIMELIERDGN